MNGKDHMLPEELGVYPNLGKQKKMRVEGGGVEWWRDGKRCCCGGPAVLGGSGRRGLGNKKTDGIEREL